MGEATDRAAAGRVCRARRRARRAGVAVQGGGSVAMRGLLGRTHGSIARTRWSRRRAAGRGARVPVGPARERAERCRAPKSVWRRAREHGANRAGSAGRCLESVWTLMAGVGKAPCRIHWMRRRPCIQWMGGAVWEASGFDWGRGRMANAVQMAVRGSEKPQNRFGGCGWGRIPQKRRIASQWLLRQVSKRVRCRIADAGIRSRLSKSASYSIQGKRASPPRGVDGNRRVSAESVSLEAEGCPECRLKAAWHSYP